MYLNRYFSNSVAPETLTFNSFSDAVIETLNEYQTLSSLSINDDFEIISAQKNARNDEIKSTVTSSDLDKFDITPVLTTQGMLRVRESDSNLKIRLHSLFNDSMQFDNENGRLVIKTNNTFKEHDGLQGAVFQAFFNDQVIYGVVQREECLHLIPESLHDNKKVLKSIMFETAMYRAFQRLNMNLVSDEIKSLVSLHELRNFLTFHNHNYNESVFALICSVIDSRSDYLQTLSKGWSSNYQAEKSYFAYALTKIAVEHNLNEEQIKDHAYSLSEQVAFSGHSLSPVRGGIYIGSNIDDFGVLSIYTSETVNGKVERCFATAGLIEIFAENVYKSDNCQVDDNVHFESKSFTHSQRNKNEYVGVFAQLTFSDKSKHSIFINKDEIFELANISTSSTWNGVFFERMAIKSAIKKAIDGCDWAIKFSGNSNRYC